MKQTNCGMRAFTVWSRAMTAMACAAVWLVARQSRGESLFPIGGTGPANGQFVVSVWRDGGWTPVGSLSYGKDLAEQRLAIGEDGFFGPVKVRVEQAGGAAAHIDTASLDGQAPVAVEGASEESALALAKLATADFDVIDAAAKPLVFTFDAGRAASEFSLTARIEGERIDERPFRYPVEDQDKAMSASSHFYGYEVNSRPGALQVDGLINDEDLGRPFFQVYSMPGTGHPCGFTYGWVCNDASNLYVAIDFVPDNTMDGGKDYTKVYVNSPVGLKEFKVSTADEQWGKAGFDYTPRAVYQHKTYEFAIPLSEIGLAGAAAGQTVPLAFDAYGTAAPPGPLAINEFLCDPPAGPEGDANGDGVTDHYQDQFIEMVNISQATLDISGWKILVGKHLPLSQLDVRHVFPAGTVLTTGSAIVVFGGGTPTGHFGGAQVETASTGSLNLDPSGTSEYAIEIRNGAGGLDHSAYYNAFYQDGQSHVLAVEVLSFSTYTGHASAHGSRGTLFSPGTLVDGTPFPGVIVWTLKDEVNGFLPWNNGLSLREAIQYVESGGTISFDSAIFNDGPASSTLSLGPEVLSRPVTIKGPGAGQLTIGGGGASRVFEITTGTQGVAIRGLAVSYGRNPKGGGVYVQPGASVAMSECDITSNTAGPVILGPDSDSKGAGAIAAKGNQALTAITKNPSPGGGFYVENGATVSLDNCRLAFNKADEGAAIRNEGGAITLVNCIVSSNTSFNGGAGIYNLPGSLALFSCSVIGNKAGGSSGGGICNYGEPGAPSFLAMTNCTISGNQTVSAAGGGIFNFVTDGATTLTNCTVYGNHASISGGGGVYNNSGAMAIRNCIIAGNSAGIAAPSSKDAPALGTPPPGHDVYGVVASNGHNRIGTLAGSSGFAPGEALAVPVSQVIDTRLRYNGGPTLCHTLVTTSPAIDAGASDVVTSPTFPGPPFTDQTGHARIRGAAVDAGAVEFVPFPTLEAIELVDRDGLNDPEPGFTNEAMIQVNLEEVYGISAQWLRLSEQSDFSTSVTIPYTDQTSVPYTLNSTAQGARTVWAALGSSGAMGPATSGTIMLDTTSPTVTISLPTPPFVVVGGEATYTITSDEPCRFDDSVEYVEAVMSGGVTSLGMSLEGDGPTTRVAHLTAIAAVSTGTMAITAGPAGIFDRAGNASPGAGPSVPVLVFTSTPTPTPSPTPSVTPTVTPTITPTATPSPTPVTAPMIVQFLLGERTLTAEQMAEADRNHDGKIDVADLIAFLTVSSSSRASRRAGS